MTMTLDKFLKELEYTREFLIWELDNFLGVNLIRGHFKIKEFSYCPLTAVGGRLMFVSLWETAAKKLDMNMVLALKIKDAADNKGDPEIREKLLKATGIKNE